LGSDDSAQGGSHLLVNDRVLGLLTVLVPVLLVSLAGISLVVIGKTGPTSIDHAVTKALAPLSPSAIWRVLVHLGNPVVVIFAMAPFAVRCLRTGRRLAAVLLVTVPVVAWAGCDLLLKPLVGRRQAGTLDESFPSGHATAVTAAAVLLIILSLPGGATSNVWRRGVVWFSMAASAVAATGSNLALVVLGWHYATDVIGGALLGALVAITAVRSAQPKRRGASARRPPASEPVWIRRRD